MFNRSNPENMPRKCSAAGCRTGYAKTKKETKGESNKSTFQFPVDNPELLAKWKVFANIENPRAHSSLCEEHFEERYLKRGKRTTLDWKNNPVPTKQVGSLYLRYLFKQVKAVINFNF